MMKRTVFRSLLIASFVVATATGAAGREGVFPNPRADRTWGRTVGGIFTSGKSIAVVIGISNYIGARAGGYPALPTAKRDADKMVDFLLNDAGFDTVYLLTDEDATKSKIDKLMTDLIPNVVTERDRFLFYWSGHGDQRFSSDGRAFGFLPLADSKSKEFSGMVSMQDLERWDRYLDARQALFVLDACLSGLAGYQTKAPLNARLEQLSLPARHLITAGTKDEIVISGDRWGGSLFTDSFILGAKGQARSPSGIVSLPVLLDFIQERVARERQLVNWSKSLTPQIQSLQHGEGYFFFMPVLPVGLPPSAATPQVPEQKGPPAAVAPEPQLNQPSATITPVTPALTPVRVRGTVEAIDGSTLTVRSRDGRTTYKVKMTDNFEVRGIIKATLSDIKDNTFIGVTGMPQADGSQKALEIHIFPEGMPRGGGHWPWDLLPTSTMTIGIVARRVNGVQGQEITLRYKEGEKKIVVVPETIIVAYVPGDESELKPGAKIFIAIASKRDDGTLTTPAISVGRDGITPPM